MLAIWDKYASDYFTFLMPYLVVMPRRCRFLSDYIKNCTFYVGNNSIKYVDSFEHLGHVITNQLTDNADILKKRSDFVGNSNKVLFFFSKLSSLIKYRLFHSYCMSLYGSELSITTRSTTWLCDSLRKSLRRIIIGLLFNSHCYLLPQLSMCLSLLDEICIRSLNCVFVTVRR